MLPARRRRLRGACAALPAVIARRTPRSHDVERRSMDATETGEPFDQFSLSVQREEVESVKAGSAVYLRKSKLFFRSTKQAALDHIDARASSARAQPAATPAAADLPEGDC